MSFSVWLIASRSQPAISKRKNEIVSKLNTELYQVFDSWAFEQCCFLLVWRELRFAALSVSKPEFHRPTSIEWLSLKDKCISFCFMQISNIKQSEICVVSRQGLNSTPTTFLRFMFLPCLRGSVHVCLKILAKCCHYYPRLKIM